MDFGKVNGRGDHPRSSPCSITMDQEFTVLEDDTTVTPIRRDTEAVDRYTPRFGLRVSLYLAPLNGRASDSAAAS